MCPHDISPSLFLIAIRASLPARGYDSVDDDAVIARSTCDEAIQLSSCAGSTRASISLRKSLSKVMDCRVKPGNDGKNGLLRRKCSSQ
jgi:hypothetical protein